jgi:hypothetical protein
MGRSRMVAVEPQKVEGDQRGFSPALSGQERIEVAPPVGSHRHSLAVAQRLGAVVAGNHLGDPCKAIGEVGGASAPDLDAFAVPERVGMWIAGTNGLPALTRNSGRTNLQPAFLKFPARRGRDRRARNPRLLITAGGFDSHIARPFVAIGPGGAPRRYR